MRELFAFVPYSVPLEKRLEVVNLALNGGFELYRERESDTRFSFRLALGDARTGESGLAACGVPYIRGEIGGILGYLRRLVRRPGLLFGLVLSLALYFLLTGMVWEVRITSGSDIDEDTVLSELAEAGLYEGARLKTLDPDTLVSNFLLIDEEIAFASVHLNGTVAEVELIAKSRGEELTPVPPPCNIVAARDAVVTDMTVFTGKQVVKPGQTVAAGDLLVSGVISDVGGTRFLPAAACVMGQVEDTLTAEVPLRTTGTYVTSTRPVSLSLTVFGHTLTFGDPSRASCESGHRLYLWNTVRLPIYVSVGLSCETETREVTRSEEEAQRLAELELERKLDAALAGGTLLSKETVEEVSDGIYCRRIRVIYETNIAKSLAFETEEQ